MCEIVEAAMSDLLKWRGNKTSNAYFKFRSIAYCMIVLTEHDIADIFTVFKSRNAPEFYKLLQG